MRFSSTSRQMSWIMPRAACAFSLLAEKIVTRPSSSMSILAPVFSWIPRMTLPPGPMISRIFSVRILMVTKRGACAESSARGPLMVSAIFSSTCSRASRARARASPMMAIDTPPILMSICSAVMPFSVPATLKSMSP